MNHHWCSCLLPLIPLCSLVAQAFPVADTAMRSRILRLPDELRGRSGDTLTWDLDLVIQQMNH